MIKILKIKDLRQLEIFLAHKIEKGIYRDILQMYTMFLRSGKQRTTELLSKVKNQKVKISVMFVVKVFPVALT